MSNLFPIDNKYGKLIYALCRKYFFNTKPTQEDCNDMVAALAAHLMSVCGALKMPNEDFKKLLEGMLETYKESTDLLRRFEETRNP